MSNYYFFSFMLSFLLVLIFLGLFLFLFALVQFMWLTYLDASRSKTPEHHLPPLLRRKHRIKLHSKLPQSLVPPFLVIVGTLLEFICIFWVRKGELGFALKHLVIYSFLGLILGIINMDIYKQLKE